MSTSPDALVQDPRLLQLRQPLQPLPVALPVAQGAPQQPENRPVSTATGKATTLPQAAWGMQPSATERQQTLQQQGTGISRIRNPFLRGLATVGDVVAGTFAPRAEQLIPGTEGNYALHLARAANAVKGEEEQQNAATRRGLEEAQARHANAQAEQLENPQAKPAANLVELFQKDPEAFARYQEATEKAVKSGRPEIIRSEGTTGQIIGVVDGGGHFHSSQDPNLDPEIKAIMGASKEKPPTLKEGEMPLPNVDQMNKILDTRYQVLSPGKTAPEQYRLPTNATQKDYDRIDKALEAEERARGTKAQQDQVNEMRRQTMAIAQQNREQRLDTQTKQEGLKAYTPALDSAERFNVMAKNYEDAVKNHDQQAMLSLLANHLGMTMGLQKGARLTKDIIKEAQTSRPWLQGIQAKFDKDGYLSGVTLTPQQMRQMVDLGRERFSEDMVKANNVSRYLGVGEGPERTPGKATINHYLSLTNGDIAKAKQLAAADGWSVK